MRILVSNDDGVHAPGIRSLANALAEAGHEVFVGAPDRERSATGHCLTLHKPLRADEVPELYNSSVKKAWKINGTPCDSAKLAMNMLLDIQTLDLVISGINRGPNLGTDVIYSGTVSAAVEGAIRGIPAVAVSIDSFDDQHYETASRFIVNLLEQVQWNDFKRHTVLNVNVPALAFEDLKGVRVSRLGLHRFKDVFEKREDLRGRPYFWQTGVVVDHGEEDDTDVAAINQGFVAITPIYYDMTHYQYLDTVKNWTVALQPV